ncbi:hypothetical protein CK204_27585, partial [Klebsiella pneumoniae]
QATGTAGYRGDGHSWLNFALYRGGENANSTWLMAEQATGTAGYRGDGHSWLNFALYRGGENANSTWL